MDCSWGRDISFFETGMYAIDCNQVIMKNLKMNASYFNG